MSNKKAAWHRYFLGCKKCGKEMSGVKSKCVRDLCHECNGKSKPKKPYFVILIVNNKANPTKILKDGAP